MGPRAGAAGGDAFGDAFGLDPAAAQPMRAERASHSAQGVLCLRVMRGCCAALRAACFAYTPSAADVCRQAPLIIACLPHDVGAASLLLAAFGASHAALAAVIDAEVAASAILRWGLSRDKGLALEAEETVAVASASAAAQRQAQSSSPQLALALTLLASLCARRRFQVSQMRRGAHRQLPTRLDAAMPTGSPLTRRLCSVRYSPMQTRHCWSSRGEMPILSRATVALAAAMQPMNSPTAAMTPATETNPPTTGSQAPWQTHRQRVLQALLCTQVAV